MTQPTITDADREAAKAFNDSLDLRTFHRYEESAADAFARHRKQAEAATATRIAAWLREQADIDKGAASLCRTGNAGRTLIRFAQRRRDDAQAIERGDWLSTEPQPDRTQYCTGCKERQDRIAELEAALSAFWPDNLGVVPDHLPDDFIFPVDISAGELRRINALRSTNNV